MQKRDGLTKGLAVAGTVLVWIPLVLPLLFAFVRYAQARVLWIDYFMPAELFPVVAVGVCSLLWAALRARSRLKLVWWGVAIAVGGLVASQALAILTGLASGEAEPVGWPWAVVLGVYTLYPLALLGLGVGGLLLLGDLFKPSRVAGS